MYRDQSQFFLSCWTGNCRYWPSEHTLHRESTCSYCIV